MLLPNLEWYASHFDPREGQISGEASPTYAILPLDRIRAIRELMPQVKLIFLMRDPVSRAWSHSKHLHCYREACFSACTTPLANVTDSQWQASFTDEWTMASGDYLGQLRRWLSVFPRDRILVEFFESIVERPARLLREIFSFLKVEPDISLSHFPLAERILPGPEGELPPRLEDHLRSLHGSRSEELVRFLRGTLSLAPPLAWQRTLATRVASSESPWDFNEADLVRISAKEEAFPTSYRQLHLNYRGFDLLFYRGRLLAVPISLGPIQELDSPALERHLEAKTVITASTLDELKECVTSRLLEKNTEKMSDLEWELRMARQESARIRIDLQTLVEEVRRPPPPVWKRKLRGLGRRIKRRMNTLRNFFG